MATWWVDRLRLTRLSFLAVLIAPLDQGGLGLGRADVVALTLALRSGIGRTISADGDPRGGHAPAANRCPACATWRWLEVLGTHNGWSQASVRALGIRGWRGSEAGEHICSRPDASPDWRDCPRVLPRIDRWGWIDQHSALHPSSVSVLVGQLRELESWLRSACPWAWLWAWLCFATTTDERTSESTSSPQALTAEDEAEILRRADEVNARLRAIFAEMDA